MSIVPLAADSAQSGALSWSSLIGLLVGAALTLVVALVLERSRNKAAVASDGRRDESARLADERRERAAVEADKRKEEAARLSDARKEEAERRKELRAAVVERCLAFLTACEEVDSFEKFFRDMGNELAYGGTDRAYDLLELSDSDEDNTERRRGKLSRARDDLELHAPDSIVQASRALYQKAEDCVNVQIYPPGAVEEALAKIRTARGVFKLFHAERVAFKNAVRAYLELEPLPKSPERP